MFSIFDAISLKIMAKNYNGYCSLMKCVWHPLRDPTGAFLNGQMHFFVHVSNDFSTELTQNSNIHNDIAPVKTALNYTCWMGYMENKECILWSWRSSSFARSTSSPGVRSRTVGSRESGLHDCRSKMLLKETQKLRYNSRVTGVISDEMWSYMLFYRLQ